VILGSFYRHKSRLDGKLELRWAITITDILHIYKNGHNFATGLPIDVLFGSRVPGWGFRLNLDFFPTGLHTHTAVACVPRDS